MKNTVSYYLLLANLLLFLAPGALFGGYSLITSPNGESLKMPVEILKNSPFSDFTIPALILFNLFGLGGVILIVMLFMRFRFVGFFAIVYGSALLIWISTQFLMIGYHMALQPMVAASAVLVLLSGLQLHRRLKPVT